jgi:hypothetical protein
MLQKFVKEVGHEWDERMEGAMAEQGGLAEQGESTEQEGSKEGLAEDFTLLVARASDIIRSSKPRDIGFIDKSDEEDDDVGGGDDDVGEGYGDVGEEEGYGKEEEEE